MLRQRCGRLLARLERAVQLLELGGSAEEGGCWQPLGVGHPGTPGPGTPGSAAGGGWGNWGAGPPNRLAPRLCLPPDYIQIAQCFEATRRRCCRLEQDGRRAREELARVEAERAALEVKLKHARNQVEVEMKKRHRAEAELEKQVWGAGCRCTPRGLVAGTPARSPPPRFACRSANFSWSSSS